MSEDDVLIEIEVDHVQPQNDNLSIR